MGLQSKQENTYTMVGTILSATVNLGTTLLDITKAEVDWTVRGAQSITGAENYFVTIELISTTQIKIDRGASTGAIVIEFEVMERTAADPFVCDRGTGTLSSNPTNIAITNRTQANRYSRVSTRGTIIGSFIEDLMVTHEISSNTNLLITGNVASGTISYVWQACHDTAQTVHTHSGTATGTSFNVDITSDGIVKEETFTLQSMRNSGPVSPGIDADELKGANITSNTNLNIYSYFADDHFFTTQLIHRPQNKVQRTDSTSSISPFSVIVGDAYVLADTFINLAVPNLYFVPTNIPATPNNFQDFGFTATINSTTSHTLQKFTGGVTSRVISEIVEYDKNPPPVIAGNEYFYRMYNRRR
jgi:hypothetical protein|tara:strand:+ start:5412 stop:6488 length:1077 start_codon:yes stop_codon:yes gene_type:complete